MKRTFRKRKTQEEEDEQDFQPSPKRKSQTSDDDDYEDRSVLKTIINKSYKIGQFVPRPKSTYDAKTALSKKFKVPTMAIKPEESEHTNTKKIAAKAATVAALTAATEAVNSKFGERKTLGIRRRAGHMMRALYDHTTPDAIVLWDPDQAPVETEELKISTDKPKKQGKSLSEILGLKREEKRLAHVVVDPVLSRVLRPHQVEGVKFLYQCTTGQVHPEAMG
jgi:DNA repair and recombination RAD54-like protein